MDDVPRHIRWILGLAIGVVMLTSALASAAVPAQAQTPTLFGVHMDLTFDGNAQRRAQAISNARDVLHAQVSRNSLLWDKVEPTQGNRDWSQTDAVVSELTAAGIEPLFTVYGSPGWANGVSGPPDARMYVPTSEPAFTTWLDQYADFMRAAVDRYRGQVHRWELWNEENEHYFWKPEPNPAQYARFYVRMRTVILAEDPTAQVSIGGLAGISASCCIAGITFLQQLNALGVYPDAVALHPYSSGAPDTHTQWQDNFDDIQLVHDYLASSGHPVPLWVTEWGWSSAAVGLDSQARYVTTSLEMLRTLYAYVAVATIFVDYDRLPEYSQGLFDASLAPKPAAFAFGAFMTSLADLGPLSNPGGPSPNPVPSTPVAMPTIVTGGGGTPIVRVAPPPVPPPGGGSHRRPSGTTSVRSAGSCSVTPMRVSFKAIRVSSRRRRVTVSAALPPTPGCVVRVRLESGRRVRVVMARRRHGRVWGSFSGVPAGRATAHLELADARDGRGLISAQTRVRVR